MAEDALAIVGGRLHVRYGLSATGDQVYLFGAAEGTPLDTLRGMLRAASAYVEQLEAKGQRTA